MLLGELTESNKYCIDKYQPTITLINKIQNLRLRFGFQGVI